MPNEPHIQVWRGDGPPKWEPLSELLSPPEAPVLPVEPVEPPTSARQSIWHIDPDFTGEGLHPNYAFAKQQDMHLDAEILKTVLMGNAASRSTGGIVEGYQFQFHETGDAYWFEGICQVLEPLALYLSGQGTYLGVTRLDPTKHRPYSGPYGNNSEVFNRAADQPWYDVDQGIKPMTAERRMALGFRTSLAEAAARLAHGHGFNKFIYWHRDVRNTETAALMGMSLEHALDLSQTWSWVLRSLRIVAANIEYDRGPGKMSTREIFNIIWGRGVLDFFEMLEYRGYKYHEAFGIYDWGHPISHAGTSLANIYEDFDHLWRSLHAGRSHPKVGRKGAEALDEMLASAFTPIVAPDGSKCVVYGHYIPALSWVLSGQFRGDIGMCRYGEQVAPELLKKFYAGSPWCNEAFLAALANGVTKLWYTPVIERDGKSYAEMPLCVDGRGYFIDPVQPFRKGDADVAGLTPLPPHPYAKSVQWIPSNSPSSQERAYFTKLFGGWYVAFDADVNQANYTRWAQIAEAFLAPHMRNDLILRRVLRELRRANP